MYGLVDLSHVRTDPSPPKHTSSFLLLLSGSAAGPSTLGWERVPRGPVTRELALEASEIAQAVPALIETLTTSPDGTLKREEGRDSLSPALNATWFYIP